MRERPSFLLPTAPGTTGGAVAMRALAAIAMAAALVVAATVPAGAAAPAASPAIGAPAASIGSHIELDPVQEPNGLSRLTWDELDADGPRYEAWARVLETYVDEEGLVDYAGLAATGRSDLASFVDALAEADTAAMSEAEQIAFWINAYNALVLWQVIESYPLESVRDLDRFFGLVADFFKQEHPVAGAQRSLDNIEHDILRAEYPDARIHWTLVCGAFGCPRLLRRPFIADDLDPLMTELAFEFIASPRALRIDRDRTTLFLSSYFDWYGGDFEAESGTVVDYVLRYAPADDAGWIRTHRDDLRVRFIDYDWTLNDQPKGPRSRRPIG